MVQSTNTNDTHQRHIHLQVQGDHIQMVQKNEANLGESKPRHLKCCMNLPERVECSSLNS